MNHGRHSQHNMGGLVVGPILAMGWGKGFVVLLMVEWVQRSSLEHLEGYHDVFLSRAA